LVTFQSRTTYRAACRYLELSCRCCRWNRDRGRDDRGDYREDSGAVLHGAEWVDGGVTWAVVLPEKGGQSRRVRFTARCWIDALITSRKDVGSYMLLHSAAA
jgi:hypothetical protein